MLTPKSVKFWRPTSSNGSQRRKTLRKKNRREPRPLSPGGIVAAAAAAPSPCPLTVAAVGLGLTAGCSAAAAAAPAVMMMLFDTKARRWAWRSGSSREADVLSFLPFVLFSFFFSFFLSFFLYCLFSFFLIFVLFCCPEARQWTTRSGHGFCFFRYPKARQWAYSSL